MCGRSEGRWTVHEHQEKRQSTARVRKESQGVRREQLGAQSCFVLPCSLFAALPGDNVVVENHACSVRYVIL